MAALLLLRGSKCYETRIWSLSNRFSCFQSSRKLLENNVTSYSSLVTANTRGIKSGRIQVCILNVDQALCGVKGIVHPKLKCCH